MTDLERLLPDAGLETLWRLARDHGHRPTAFALMRQSLAPAFEQAKADEKRKADEAGVAMFALWDELKALGKGFDTWSDAAKGAVAAAVIDHRPPTAEDIARTQDVARRLGFMPEAPPAAAALEQTPEETR